MIRKEQTFCFLPHQPSSLEEEQGGTIPKGRTDLPFP
jgi:hypothetical protein